MSVAQDKTKSTEGIPPGTPVRETERNSANGADGQAEENFFMQTRSARLKNSLKKVPVKKIGVALGMLAVVALLIGGAVTAYRKFGDGTNAAATQSAAPVTKKIETPAPVEYDLSACNLIDTLEVDGADWLVPKGCVKPVYPGETPSSPEAE